MVLLLKWDPVLVATVAGKGKVSPKNMPKDQVKTPSPPGSSWTNSQAALLSKGFKTSSSAFVVHPTDDPNWRPQTSQKWGWIPFLTSVTFFQFETTPHHFQLLGADMSNQETVPNLRGAAPEASCQIARCRFRGFPSPVNFVWLRWFLPNSSITSLPPNKKDSNPKGSSWNLKIWAPPSLPKKKRILSHDASMGLVYLKTFAWLIYLLIC